MSDWTAGYVADIGYTYGYYGELNPARVAQAFLSAGLVPPEMGTACELGFGQGVSTAIHAAASATQWFGTDFNPSQAGFAQHLAEVSDSGAKLYDQAFAEFCARPELPDFDFIGLHGIWSWISDENRHIIVDFIRRKLKVGGVLYISYNTEAGWASMVPMRRLMTKHSAVMSAPGVSTVQKVDEALGFVDKLLAVDSTFVKANPLLTERMKQIKGQNRNYLAHEYFNQDWHPMAFSTMADWLAPAKLDFACSTHLLDHIGAINLSEAQQKLLSEIPDQVFRESVRDVIVNQQFRRDYWVRGPRQLTAVENLERTRKLRVVLITLREEITLKAKGSLGEADMNAEVYNAILDVLEDHKPRTIGQIEQIVAPKGVTYNQLVQSILILAGKGVLVTVQDDKAIAKARPRCEKLNMHFIDRSRNNSDITFLASPVTGGGIQTTRFQQLFLLGRLQGRKTAEELAELVWAVIKLEGRKLVKAGVTIDSEEDNLRELVHQANEFNTKRMAMYKALGIIG